MSTTRSKSMNLKLPMNDEDVIDVDEEDGGPRLSKRGALKSEARTKEHLLTHRFKNHIVSLVFGLR